MRGGGASLDRTARARPFDPPPTLTVPPSRRSSGRQPHLVYDTEAGALKRAEDWSDILRYYARVGR